MKNIFTLLAAVLLTATTYAQIGINNETPDASAALDITSTTGGLLPPRMTTTQRDAISAAKGLVLFNTTTNTLQINEGDAATANWVSLSAAATSATYSIGDVVNGGVVFWIDSTGQHGLVCSFSDYATDVEWGCMNTDLPNGANVTGSPPIGLGAEIGDGFNNTNDILQDCPTAPAALAARSLGAQWFLPSAKELNQMYDNRATLEGVSGFNGFSYFYWSSTEDDYGFAWGQNFSGGGQLSGNKDYPGGIVRAVRAF
ncbi:DUF1566 domain-containing protein [Flavobacteriaceae bacterium]|nr:DUF1566 domain-containing protein [Flavobacteriaceae bacterium]